MCFRTSHNEPAFSVIEIGFAGMHVVWRQSAVSIIPPCWFPRSGTTTKIHLPYCSTLYRYAATSRLRPKPRPPMRCEIQGSADRRVGRFTALFVFAGALKSGGLTASLAFWRDKGPFASSRSSNGRAPREARAGPGSSHPTPARVALSTSLQPRLGRHAPSRAHAQSAS